MPISLSNTQYEDFHGTNKLNNVAGTTFVLTNNGYSTITFKVTPPGTSNASVISFQGSTDGTTYENVTFRQIGGDGYTQVTSGIENYIGSVIGLQSIRFKTDSTVGAASLSGTVQGRLSMAVSTLEGIEHGHPPHKIGNTINTKGFSVTTTTATTVTAWTPATSAHKVVITDLTLTYRSANSNREFDLTVHDQQYNTATTLAPTSAWIYSADISSITTSSTNSIGFKSPWVVHNTGGSVYVDINPTAGSGNIFVRGVLHGYEEYIDIF